MRLSEAIRLGALLSPPGKDGYMDGPTRCALGAASDAVGIPATFVYDSMRMGIDYVAMDDRWSILHRQVRMPTRPWRMAFVDCVIWSLNDCCDWTREQIADWVETIEQEHQCEASASPQVEHAVAVVVAKSR